MKNRPPLLKRFRPRPAGTAERRRTRLQARLGKKTSRARTAVSLPRVGLAAATVTILSILLCIHLLPGRVNWRLGDVADRDIIAQRTVRYEDTEATAHLKEEAAEQVENRYEEIPGATLAASEWVRLVFDRIDQELPSSVASKEDAGASGAAGVATEVTANTILSQMRQQAQGSANRLPTARDITVLMQQNLATRHAARDFAVRLVEREMSRGITEGNTDLEEARKSLERSIRPTALPARVASASVAIARAALTSTRRVNSRETDRDRQSAKAKVVPQMQRLPAGTLVVRDGEKVTQAHLDAFLALGLRNDRLDASAVLTIILLVLFLTGVALVYLRQFHTDLYVDTSRMLLLALLCVFSVTGLKVGSALLGLSLSGLHFGYLGMMSVASAGMVIALLLSPRVATLIVALLAVASGLILNNELRYTVITLGSSLVGIISVTTLRNRGDLLRSFLLLGATNAFLNALVGQMEGDLPREILQGMLWGIVCGLFALALFYIGVAVFEKWFGLTTHLRLLELTDPATPLLQEFRMQVPGTYAHSLMVSNLSSAAAEAIGADALLIRVAAYYHDIGKMNRPEFFIENQSNADNIHDRLAPSLSAIILASHVKEGLEIAEEIGLPPKVREIISQHHGTTLMKYFYHRATGGQGDSSLEAQFRYPGPKPQTREAAILMLADTVEAASRTLQRPTPTRISEFIGKLIEDKLADGQLDECDITLRDVATCKTVFTRILSGALHARIEYPSDEKRPAPPAPAPPLISKSFPETNGSTTAVVDTAHDVNTASPQERMPDGSPVPSLKAAIADDTGPDPLTLAEGAFPEELLSGTDKDGASQNLTATEDLTAPDGDHTANNTPETARRVGQGRLGPFSRSHGKAPRKRR